MKNLLRRLTSFQIILLSFAAVILLGSLLLVLPIASQSREFTPFLDALFTATSATCVTGLVVHDTATYWSLFGQGVVLVLIQIGGMGVVTMAVAISSASGSRVSLKQRSTMQEAIAAPQVGGILPLTGFIIRMTVIFELAGAVLMAPVFCGEFGLAKGLWYSLFHGVSAFCNAGFDLMGAAEPYSSLTHFAGDPVINLVIMALIIIGGIGFLVWNDVRTHKFRLRRYRMQSKVVLAVSGILILLPAIFYFFVDFSGETLGKRIWYALFQSVTARTAGFNTADLTALTGPGLTVMIFLMLIGGSPGSTAGGMKTTTVAVMFSTAIAVFRRRESPQFFGRRLTDDTVRNAVAILTLYLFLFLTGGCAISLIEGLPLAACLFETASAVGTVGLTLGLTPSLGAVSHVVLILLMYFGRVGGLTLIFAAVTGRPLTAAKLPQEKLTVG